MNQPLKALNHADIPGEVLSLIEQHGGSPDADLISEIISTALKMAKDKTSRGDLKIINSALKELRYAFRVFAPYRLNRKVSIFGSARTPRDAPEFQQARKFASLMAEGGFMVITGAGPGIMQAANEGAGRDMSFGVNILLPFEQQANPILDGDPKLIHLKYFFTRKLLFVKETHAVALFPGGVGTQDEGFETLTLLQTGKSHPLPIVFIDAPGGAYWKDWLQYLRSHLVEKDMINQEDLSLFRITDNAEEAVQEFCRFYSRYHSSRYVRDRLIIRLSQPLPEGRLDELNQDFFDILTKGRIELSETHTDEHNEPHIAHLDRLAMHFDRVHFGRLRRLIDRINDP